MIKDKERGNSYYIGSPVGYKGVMNTQEASLFVGNKSRVSKDEALYSDLNLYVVNIQDDVECDIVGVKYDDGKYLAATLEEFSLALIEVAKAATYGAKKKYSREGWKYVDNAVVRYHDAEWRHRLEGGGDFASINEESGLHHKAHEIWNALASYTLFLKKENEK